MIETLRDGGAALITGASSGIGATYAEALARRGFNLVLVARNLERLEQLADRLYREHGVSVKALHADLTVPSDRLRVRRRIAASGGDFPPVTLLVNNAGSAPEGGVLTSDPETLQSLIELNVVALHELAIEASHAFVARRRGAIINLASVVALMPENFNACYSASKAFVLTLIQGLARELTPHGVRIQAVLPGLTRTEIFERAGIDINDLDPETLMSARDLVEAALSGFDKGEVVTVPSLEDTSLLSDFEAARFALWPHLSRRLPAPRYGVEALADA